ncbi:MAG: bifunctional nicotinamidase/pyrazinamidase [Parachlamydiaceae bacterium]|nr:bifunctional nicotinamidase/pyrazinamidase [Parachlamydiaceae bacterium]
MTALLLVDIQIDFLPSGALAVKDSDQIIPVVNRLMDQSFDFIIASQDWHPKNHSSFALTHLKQPGDLILWHGLEQILWPVHCVQQTSGAELSPSLNSIKINKIFYKGTDQNIDSYSAFYDNEHRKSTGLVEFLKEKEVHDIYITGLATDYCVKYTVIDALKLGFNVFVIEDGCKGVNLHPNDTKDALYDMQEAGAKIIFSCNLKF